ncbi:MAG: pseudouridine synthase [Lachnospiraceae bacterium]|nr:pseudouridine synthase [Lachnospiraceae bacterium]
MTRLNKYLADCGVCSRREADRLIEEGRVQVNGTVAGMGCQVSESDKVTVNGKTLTGKATTVVLAFYKPVGVTCSEKDKHAEKIINDYIKYPVRVTYAGRLDKESEGLLLLTNDGKLIDAMMRGANGHEKEYVVKVNKEITEEFLKKMRAGVYLKELSVQTRPCKVERIGKLTFRIILTQGLNRQIRRMCQTLGYEVKQLKRERVMNIRLGKLTPGSYRKVTGEELERLYQLAKEEENGR